MLEKEWYRYHFHLDSRTCCTLHHETLYYDQCRLCGIHHSKIYMYSMSFGWHDGRVFCRRFSVSAWTSQGLIGNHNGDEDERYQVSDKNSGNSS
ncbi:MAG: hypothetical protein GYB26_10280 [Gammaproteobacteria bacterium]|nr:hypothetical protein [Gammaproteobacteria bacterium]